MRARVQRALAVYAAHRWNATSRLCACGEFFEATLAGNAAHKEHRMLEVLQAADVVPEDEFCSECAGPYEENMDQYGGHWDTCPNRAKAIMPEGDAE